MHEVDESDDAVRRRELTAKVKEMLAERAEARKARKPDPHPPRYDNVFFDGLEWLNKL